MTQQYVGVKIITAWPADRQKQVNICGIDCKPGTSDCNGYCKGQTESPPAGAMQQGYGVRYADGYQSWSPKAAFDEAYLPLGHIGGLPPHEQRLVAEQALLADKLNKLSVFLASPEAQQIDPLDNELMTQQFRVMEQYMNVLEMRLRRMTLVREEQPVE